MHDASLERPYEGAKEMLLVENIEDKVFLRDLFNTIYDELPAPKPKKKK
jgi:tfoX N-domain family protein